jgi:hypothetical protein
MIRSLYFNIVVAYGHEVGNCVFLKFLLGLEEGTDLPFMIIMRV